MDRRTVLKLAAMAPVLLRLGWKSAAAETAAKQIRLYSAERKGYIMSEKIVKSDEEWKQTLTPEQYRVLRKKGTETAFTGRYWNNHQGGIYLCAACGNDLFDSSTKFESGSGWPSFWAPIAKENVETEEDDSMMMHRTEVHCARCGGHLGHIFDDGPKPTGLRYCITSAALSFKKKEG